ncbi:hypothetical protein PG989_016014 [Apiospora arundinis]
MHRVSPGMEPQFRTAGKPVCASAPPRARRDPARSDDEPVRRRSVIAKQTSVPCLLSLSLSPKALATAQDGGQACRAPDNRAEEQDTNVRRVV